MNINEAFPSNYLKSSDLGGGMAKVKIDKVLYEHIGTDNKLVMYFQGKEKGMVLNKTNAQTIAAEFGPDTDNWTGAEINVFSMKVDFQGRMVDGLRVRVPPARKAAPPVMPNARQAQQPAPAMAGDDDIIDDDVPF
jgi:hypothetical protein